LINCPNGLTDSGAEWARSDPCEETCVWWAKDMSFWQHCSRYTAPCWTALQRCTYTDK